MTQTTDLTNVVTDNEKKEHDVSPKKKTDIRKTLRKNTKVIKSYMVVKNLLVRETMAELFGTWLLVFFINASIAQNMFFKEEVKRNFSRDNNSSLLSVNLTVGFAVTLAVLAVGKVSGGHLNPAVSLSMFISGKISILKFFCYVVAQHIGAFIGSVTVYVAYLDVFQKFMMRVEDAPTGAGVFTKSLASIFATFPHPDVSWFGALFDQTLGTTLLIIGILALIDKNNKLEQGAIAGYIGILVFVIGTTLCYNCGYAINPARDLAPRFFTWLVGYDAAFSNESGYYFFIVPTVGPLIGAVLGTFIYHILVKFHWPQPENDDELEMDEHEAMVRV